MLLGSERDTSLTTELVAKLSKAKGDPLFASRLASLSRLVEPGAESEKTVCVNGDEEQKGEDQVIDHDQGR